MIQRVQSIWLLLASISILCLLFVPMVGFNSSTGYFTLNGSGLKADTVNVISTNYPLLISTIMAALTSLVNIFNFRNRKLQIRIAFLSVVLLLALLLWFFQIGRSIDGLKELDIEVGIFLPLVAIIFLLLAIRGIKNDEKLIRSADRLR